MLTVPRASFFSIDKICSSGTFDDNKQQLQYEKKRSILSVNMLICLLLV